MFPTVPFVKHKSIINFSDARSVQVEQLMLLYDKGQIHFRENASIDLITRIQKALLASQFANRGIKVILREQGFDA